MQKKLKKTELESPYFIKKYEQEEEQNSELSLSCYIPR